MNPEGQSTSKRPTSPTWRGRMVRTGTGLRTTLGVLILWAAAGLPGRAAAAADNDETPAPCRLFIVSSYHPEYLWSQDTQKGVCAGLLEFGFLDTQAQADELTATGSVQGTHAIVRKAWMDSKRKNTKADIAAAVQRIVDEIRAFSPDLILLGDDNAANYIGNQFADTDTPVVFWGINGLPLKYGLLDSLDKPGHNITGVYQAGYLKESLGFLRKIVPAARSFAVLSDDSETGRSKAKELQSLQRTGQLPLELRDVVITDSFAEWRTRAAALQSEVDAFFVLNHNSLRDEQGRPVDQMEAGRWYLRNVRIPECGHEKQFVQEGMLCACDDSGFNQGYEAVKLAHRILHQHEDPAGIAVTAPGRGPFIVNRERATGLGIALTPEMGIEAYEEKALALDAEEASPPKKATGGP